MRSELALALEDLRGLFELDVIEPDQLNRIMRQLKSSAVRNYIRHLLDGIMPEVALRDAFFGPKSALLEHLGAQMSSNMTLRDETLEISVGSNRGLIFIGLQSPFDVEIVRERGRSLKRLKQRILSWEEHREQVLGWVQRGGKYIVLTNLKGWYIFDDKFTPNRVEPFYSTGLFDVLYHLEALSHLLLGKGSEAVSDLASEIAFRLLQGGETSSRRVLDVGCNMGQLDRLLAGVFGHVLGLDISHEALQHWGKTAAGLKNMDCILFGGEGLSLIRDGTFDVIFAKDVFIHLPGPLIENFWLVAFTTLRPDGVLLFNILENRPSVAAGIYWIIKLNPSQAIRRTFGLELPPSWTHPDSRDWTYGHGSFPLGRPYKQEEVIKKLLRVGFRKIEVTPSVFGGKNSLWIKALKPTTSENNSHTLVR